MVNGYKSQSMMSNKNERQCTINKNYYSHESSTREAQRCVVHCTLKKLSIMTNIGALLNPSIMKDIGLSLVNSSGDKNVAWTKH